MITETAIVVSIENNQTWVETQRKSACGQCSANKGCGTSVLSKVIGNKLSKIKAINNINAQVGDEVVIGLKEQSLLKGALMTYMLPLVFLFIFSLVGQVVSENLQFQDSELLVIIFAVVGLLLGLRQVKVFSIDIAENENYQPVILKKSNSSVLVNL
ncbi:MAG: SoxR reducing system RseC family protein [Gammaproteobacteria bacterium]|nr:SoxR reducing system RseC family protein [Gammaproteobacteria bacterium]